MRQLQVHIRRIVIDSGVHSIDPRALPASLEQALADRFTDRTGSAADHACGTSAAAATIADAVASRIARVNDGGGGVYD
jgi:hypothetical protein